MWGETWDKSHKVRSALIDWSLISNLSIWGKKKPTQSGFLSVASVWFAAAGPQSSETQRRLKADTSKVASVHLHLPLKPQNKTGDAQFSTRYYPEPLTPQGALFWKSTFCWQESRLQKLCFSFFICLSNAAGLSVWGFQGKFFFLPAVVSAGVVHVDFGTNLNGRKSEWCRNRKWKEHVWW